MRIYFIHPDAQINAYSIAAVNDGQPLQYGQGYDLASEIAKALLADTDTWSQTSPTGKSAPPVEGSITEPEGN